MTPPKKPRPPKRQVTRIKIESTDVLSYKSADVLRKFISEQGYITPRSLSGITQKQQRRLTREIKRARHLALLPYTQTL